MEILYSALIGCFFGAICALAETKLLLNAVKKGAKRAAEQIAAGEDAETVNKEQTTGVMKAFVIRYFLNVLAILAVFLLRDMLPYKWEYILLFFGVSLAGLGQILLTVSGLKDRLSSGKLF